MRYRSLGWLLLGAWIGVWPLAAHADYLSNARDALKKGDLRAAQIDLRNAVRSDPQNAEAHYWLGRVSFELGDPVAAEREADAALDRGFDPQLATRLLGQALLAQNKFDDLLQKLKPDGKDADLDAIILVFRGYAQIGLKQPDAAQKAFNDAEQRRRTRSSRCWPKRGCWRRAATSTAPRRRSTMRSRYSRNRPRRCWQRRSSCARRAT